MGGPEWSIVAGRGIPPSGKRVCWVSFADRNIAYMGGGYIRVEIISVLAKVRPAEGRAAWL